ncbi:MAG: ABC transporter permease subunit [Dehalococcoidia bacterium]|nr:ABC transporter permease subunit [Dehalococcoidia bacterium]
MSSGPPDARVASPASSQGTRTDGSAGGGSIYDLGYRHYEGVRLGRRHAILALYVESLRGAFGLGRGAAAKIAPFVLIFIALVPAVIQLAIAALIPAEFEFVSGDDYYSGVKYILALYAAAVAPDIVGRDQRNRSLTLYFSRAIGRTDYALGKLAAMTTAMLIITLVPQLILFAGNALSTQDFGAYLAEEWDQVLPILGSALGGSLLIASIGTAIGAQTPQRAFATVGIVVAFLLPLVVAGVMVEIGTDATVYAAFLSPLDLVDGFTWWIFRSTPDEFSTVALAGFDLWAYTLAAVVATVLASGLLVRRYQRVQA